MPEVQKRSTQVGGPRMPNKIRRTEFGRWLKERREARGLTQLDLAKLLSYENPQIISNIERGFSALPARRTSDYAQHLGCPTLELEIRRMWASSKDDSSAHALSSILQSLPILDFLHSHNVPADRALLALQGVA